MFNRKFKLFRLFGFEVGIDATWIVLAILVAWSLSTGYFPFKYQDLSTRQYWMMGVIGALGLFVSIVAHEFCHSLVARRTGMPMKGITLFIFGGVAEMEREPARPEVEFLMAVAGPISSLVLAGLLFGIESVAETGGWPTAVIGVVHYLGLVNLVLAIFNLVPAFPLDGGRMLRAALWKWTGDLHRATRIASQIGAGFGIALMVLGALAFIQGSFIAGMWWVLIGAFLRSAANGAYRQLLINVALSEKRVGELMTGDPVTVPRGTTIDQLLEDYVYRHHHKLLPVTDDRDLIGCITVADVKQVPRERRATTTVGEIAAPCSAANTVHPDMAARELVIAMGRPGAASRYMVVEDGRLLGVISRRDLSDYVALKLELE